jgi:hypothetical protein
MKTNYWIISILMSGLLIMTGCVSPEKRAKEDTKSDEIIQDDTGQLAFLANLAAFCGKSFEGREVFMAEGRESWADKQFIMHVTVCEFGMVHIPFYLDDDHSRTWMFFIEDGKLRFRHDHRHADGTPEDVTLYGGYADSSGDAYCQNFPADEYTCDMLPNSCTAEWRVKLSDDLSTFRYMLFSDGELFFEAAFDLSNPM